MLVLLELLLIEVGWTHGIVSGILMYKGAGSIGLLWLVTSVVVEWLRVEKVWVKAVHVYC